MKKQKMTTTKTVEAPQAYLSLGETRKKQDEITEKGLRQLFKISIDMECVAGFDGYFKKLNPAWKKTLGYTIEELKAKPFLEFVHPEDRDATVNAMKNLATGAKVFSFENRYRCKDGSYRWIQWNSVSVVKEKAIYAIARDVTQRKEMERKLQDDRANLEKIVGERT